MTKQEKIARFPKYLFCDDGSVISLTRRKPFVMKPIRIGSYVGLQLVDDGGDLQKQYVHRLIAEAFHGPCPRGMVCRHLNGDKNDNRAANLSWGTQSQNNIDKRAHGTSPDGERNPMSKLTRAKVREMRDERKSSGRSYKEIAEDFGVSAMTAYRAINHQSWRTA